VCITRFASVHLMFNSISKHAAELLTFLCLNRIEAFKEADLHKVLQRIYVLAMVTKPLHDACQRLSKTTTPTVALLPMVLFDLLRGEHGMVTMKEKNGRRQRCFSLSA